MNVKFIVHTQYTRNTHDYREFFFYCRLMSLSNKKVETISINVNLSFLQISRKVRDSCELVFKNLKERREMDVNSSCTHNLRRMHIINMNFFYCKLISLSHKKKVDTILMWAYHFYNFQEKWEIHMNLSLQNLKRKTCTHNLRGMPMISVNFFICSQFTRNVSRKVRDSCELVFTKFKRKTWDECEIHRAHTIYEEYTWLSWIFFLL